MLHLLWFKCDDSPVILFDWDVICFSTLIHTERVYDKGAPHPPWNSEESNP